MILNGDENVYDDVLVRYKLQTARGRQARGRGSKPSQARARSEPLHLRPWRGASQATTAVALALLLINKALLRGSYYMANSKLFCVSLSDKLWQYYRLKNRWLCWMYLNFKETPDAQS
eukprot:scaffold144963_cov45-Prasinocladus_malaysianus.AAC.2